ncbi:MAG: lipid-A-disaccharide synthase [Cyanobacteria bacterium REEB459]|nr:lipid-A-disaccharide synthase [Cyanobacteria bacterium REEB459]
MACDILILSNGPGEISTWVRPVVAALRVLLPDAGAVRISVVLSPCANACGREAAMAAALPGVDRVQAAADFFPFLLRGKTADNWDWHTQGVVLFLGGDQLYSVLIGKRLGYRIVVYAEWKGRWPRWVDGIACMNHQVVAAASPRWRSKYEVIGDLMADIVVDPTLVQPVRDRLGLSPDQELIGLMPGSKPAKLSLGLPFCLATAAAIHRQRPQTVFVIPVAPMLTLETLAQFANPDANPDTLLFEGCTTAELVATADRLPRLRTATGLEVWLWPSQPAYDLLSQVRLCLTTVGANTAELGALAVPMLVLLPTQKLEVMKAWDGLPGLLANLPLVGDGLARGMNRLILAQIYRQGRLFAWPNLWAGRAIVPELIGPLQPHQVATQVIDYLNHPEQLAAMTTDLQSLRGPGGAAARLATLVVTALQGDRLSPKEYG